MSQIQNLEKLLKMNKQEHLLQFYSELSTEEREKYVRELEKIDFNEMTRLFEKANQSYSADVQLLDDHMKPIPKEQFESEVNSSPEKLEQYYNTGLEEISKGNVAVLLMAGGQGTRLGVNYPKGMYSVGLLSNKTLFQIQAERILKIQQLANSKYNHGGKVVWFIMTSGPTIHQTKDYLVKNNYFGLHEDDVIIFEQGLLPCFTFEGKIFMEAKNKVALAPDGNGGIYKALKTNGILSTFKSRNIKYVHVHSVDNILIKVADPTFIGYSVTKNADCGAKVVQKASPTEAVGVVCLVNNKFQVVEYSEITEKTANLKHADGSLVFNAGNICNHFFTTDFLEKIADVDMKLHVAKKKIPHVNSEGIFVKPTEPNGIKIEKFVFDVFEFSKNFVTWEVPRDSEFSALKNSNEAGKDCPETAKRDLYRLHKKYLEKANVQVDVDEVEISPMVSYGGEGLTKLQGTVITAQKHITEI